MELYNRNKRCLYIMILIIIAFVSITFNTLLKHFADTSNYYVTASDNSTPIGEIVESTKIEQQLPDLDYINNIEIQLATYQKKISSKISISIINQLGDRLFNETIDGSKVQDNAYMNFNVGIKNKDNNKLTLIIKGIDGSEGNALTIWMSDKKNDNLNLFLNGQQINKVLNLKINSNDSWGNGNKILSLFMIGLLFITSIAIIINIKDSIEHNFLIVYSGLMIFFIFLNPMGQTPDEYMHFLRAYSISEGKILGIKSDDGYSIGSYLPKGLYDKVVLSDGGICTIDNNIKIENYNKSINKDTVSDKEFYTLNNTLVYPVISYLPQTIGIFIGKLLNMSVFGVFTMGRFLNMIFYGLLSFSSINIIKKKYKLILMFIALLPMSFYLGTSLSTDSILIGLSLLYIALCFSETELKERKNIRIWMYSVGILMSLCKFTYLPIILLHWLTDKNHKKNIKKGILFDVICISIVGLWNLFVMLNVESISNDQNIIPLEQVKFILMHPVRYIFTILYTIYYNFYDYILQLNTIGWLTHTLKLLVPFTILLFIVYSFVKTSEEDREKLKSGELAIIAVSIIGTIIFIFTALYLTWTPVGYKMISGVQGRYFIPVIPIMMIFLKEYFCNTYIKIKDQYRVLSLISLIGLIYTILYIIIYFWTPLR